MSDLDEDGCLLVRPVNWDKKTRIPRIYVKHSLHKLRAPGIGDRLLVRLTLLPDNSYDAKIIKALGKNPKKFLAVVGEDANIHPVIRGKFSNLKIETYGSLEPKRNDLIVAETIKSRHKFFQSARVIKNLGKGKNPNIYSHIAIHSHNITNKFSSKTLEEANKLGPASIDNRKDLRNLPLITIDGEDARDFDDAVFAEPWREIPNGWHIIVAIADVSWYVRPGTELDKSARERGNSVYFPDTVVPMLPEPLSNDWCSLKPNLDRPCIAIHIWIDGKGNRISHRIERAIMRSHARLTYTHVQAALDGRPNSKTEPLMENVITPLLLSYECLLLARMHRGPLEIYLPEISIKFNKQGNVKKIFQTKITKSHKIIEEFMVLANVVAAESLKNIKSSVIHRVHEPPPKGKLDDFCNFSNRIGIEFPKKSNIRASDFNQLIKNASDSEYKNVLCEAIIQTQSKAIYSPENHGHFGLSLVNYCHFTSPIRRYADLVIHRLLVSQFDLGEGGDEISRGDLIHLGKHLSLTEQRASEAERDVVRSFSIETLEKKVGEEVFGKISGVTKSGIFVSIEGYFADGFVPLRQKGKHRIKHKRIQGALNKGSEFFNFKPGDPIRAVVKSADPICRSLILKVSDT